jgi:polyphosphate kinase 2 (PPK2 family)
MGYTKEKDVERFLENVPRFEQWLVESGIILIKLWLEVGMEEQEARFKARIEDPLRQWKLSPMDTASFGRWYDYSRARDMMFEATDTRHAPWRLVRSDDKRRARLNVISYILKTIPYKRIARDKVKLPKRSGKGSFNDQASLRRMKFLEERY